MADPMPEESPETLERLATEIALAERQDAPVNRALSWYLALVCFMPTIMCIALALIISVVHRMSWVARFQIDGDWLVLGYVIFIGLSTFVLGFVHSRVYDALHPENNPKRGGQLWLYAFRFFFFQLLLIPLTITVLAGLLSLFF